MRRRSLVFWSHWIKFISFFLIAYGLAMVFIPQLMRTPVASILFDTQESFRSAFVSTSEPQSTFLNILSGLLGTVTIGWAVQMAWIAHKPFWNGEIWAWNSLATSVSVWAALEFYYKLIEGINGVGLFAHFGLWIAFAIPLITTYRQFHPVIPTHIEKEASREMGNIS